jgi:hypothetical protein
MFRILLFVPFFFQIYQKLIFFGFKATFSLKFIFYRDWIKTNLEIGFQSAFFASFSRQWASLPVVQLSGHHHLVAGLRRRCVSGP